MNMKIMTIKQVNALQYAHDDLVEVLKNGAHALVLESIEDTVLELECAFPDIDFKGDKQ